MTDGNMSESNEHEDSISSGSNAEADPRETITPSRTRRTGTKRKTGRPKGSKHSPKAIEQRKLAQMLSLAAKNVPAAQIARCIDMNERTVQHRLKKFDKLFKELKNVKDYENVRADLLSATELKMLKSLMSEDKIAKASLNNVAYAFQQVFNANRLTRGQSTANVDTKTQFTSVQIELSDLSD